MTKDSDPNLLRPQIKTKSLVVNTHCRDLNVYPFMNFAKSAQRKQESNKPRRNQI